MPAASEPGLVTFRPFGVRIAAVVLGLLLFGVTAAIWFAFPQSVRDEFTMFQRLTVLVFGLAYAAAGHALGRSRIDVRSDGLHVVNGYRSHTFGWGEVRGVTLRVGSPWAILELADGTTSAAMGIQGSDGQRAVAQVKRLRTLLAGHSDGAPTR